MESLVVRALESKLKYYLRSFSRDQFRLQGRTVQLSNLDLNGDVLHGIFGLPSTFRVAQAKVEKLEIKLPAISYVLSEPTIVYISKLDLVISETESNETSVSKSTTSLKSSSYGYADKIADGMTLEIKTLNLMIETKGGNKVNGHDSSSWMPPIASITMKQLKLFTTNEFWNVVSLAETRQFFQNKNRIYIFKKLKWHSLSIDLLPHPDMFNDENFILSLSSSNHNKAKRAFFGGERFIDNISGNAFITMCRSEENNPIGFEIDLKLSEVICPQISEPCIRAILRFLTGVYFCLNRSDLKSMTDIDTESAQNSYISVSVETIFFRIKETDYQLELLLQSLFYSSRSKSEKEYVSSTSKLFFGNLFLRDTLTYPPIILIQPDVNESDSVNKTHSRRNNIPVFADENLWPKIYPLPKKAKLDDSMIRLFSSKTSPSPSPPHLSSQTVIQCEPIKVCVHEQSCLRIASLLADGFILSNKIIKPEFSINYFSMHIKSFDFTIPVPSQALFTKSNSVLQNIPHFQACNLKISNLFYHQDPFSSFKVVNLESDPNFFPLWPGQPVSFGQLKQMVSVENICVSLVRKSSDTNKLEPQESQNIWECVQLSGIRLEAALLSIDGNPFVGFVPPDGFIRLGFHCKLFSIESSYSQLLFVLSMNNYIKEFIKMLFKVSSGKEEFESWIKSQDAKKGEENDNHGDLEDKTLNNLPEGTTTTTTTFSDTGMQIFVEVFKFKLLESFNIAGEKSDHRGHNFHDDILEELDSDDLTLVNFFGGGIDFFIGRKSLGGAAAVSLSLKWNDIRIECLDEREIVEMEGEWEEENEEYIFKNDVPELISEKSTETGYEMLKENVIGLDQLCKETLETKENDSSMFELDAFSKGVDDSMNSENNNSTLKPIYVNELRHELNCLKETHSYEPLLLSTSETASREENSHYFISGSITENESSNLKNEMIERTSTTEKLIDVKNLSLDFQNTVALDEFNSENVKKEVNEKDNSFIHSRENQHDQNKESKSKNNHHSGEISVANNNHSENKYPDENYDKRNAVLFTEHSSGEVKGNDVNVRMTLRESQRTMKNVLWKGKKQNCWQQSSGMDFKSSYPFIDISIQNIVPYNKSQSSVLRINTKINNLRLNGGMEYTEYLLYKFKIFDLDGNMSEEIIQFLDILEIDDMFSRNETQHSDLTKFPNQNLDKTVSSDEIDVDIQLNNWIFALENPNSFSNSNNSFYSSQQHFDSNLLNCWQLNFRKIRILSKSEDGLKLESKHQGVGTNIGDRIQEILLSIEGIRAVKPKYVSSSLSFSSGEEFSFSPSNPSSFFQSSHSPSPMSSPSFNSLSNSHLLHPNSRLISNSTSHIEKHVTHSKSFKFPSSNIDKHRDDTSKSKTYRKFSSFHVPEKRRNDSTDKAEFLFSDLGKNSLLETELMGKTKLKAEAKEIQEEGLDEDNECSNLNGLNIELVLSSCNSNKCKEFEKEEENPHHSIRKCDTNVMGNEVNLVMDGNNFIDSMNSIENGVENAVSCEQNENSNQHVDSEFSQGNNDEWTVKGLKFALNQPAEFEATKTEFDSLMKIIKSEISSASNITSMFFQFIKSINGSKSNDIKGHNKHDHNSFLDNTIDQITNMGKSSIESMENNLSRVSRSQNSSLNEKNYLLVKKSDIQFIQTSLLNVENSIKSLSQNSVMNSTNHGPPNVSQTDSDNSTSYKSLQGIEENLIRKILLDLGNVKNFLRETTSGHH